MFGIRNLGNCVHQDEMDYGVIEMTIEEGRIVNLLYCLGPIWSILTHEEGAASIELHNTFLIV